MVHDGEGFGQYLVEFLLDLLVDGLIGHEELTQKDVAEILGISQSYISRLEKKIIRKLRNKLKDDE